MKIKIQDEEIVMKEVKSSVIRAIAWHKGHLVILMNANNSFAYKYMDVEKEIVDQGFEWASIGQWYNKIIKGKFDVVHVFYTEIKEQK